MWPSLLVLGVGRGATDFQDYAILADPRVGVGSRVVFSLIKWVPIVGQTAGAVAVPARVSKSTETSKPNRCRSAYSNIEPWPAERTKRSRSGHNGFFGLCFRLSRHRTSAISAIPMGAPG